MYDRQSSLTSRRYNTRMGTMGLSLPEVRTGGHIPFFATERKRSEAALIQALQEAFAQGISTRKTDWFAKARAYTIEYALVLQLFTGNLKYVLDITATTCYIIAVDSTTAYHYR